MERLQLLAIVSLFGAVSVTAKATPITPFDVGYDENGAAYVKGEVLVKTRSPAALERLLATTQENNMQVLSDRKSLASDARGSWYKVKSTSVQNLLLKLRGKAMDGVQITEPNYVYHTAIGPNPRPSPKPQPMPELQPAPQLPGTPKADPRLGELYGLQKIQAESGWAITRGSKKVIVADIDTGVDYNHPDLANNLWRRKKSDASGKVTEEIGYNFRDNSPLPFDDNGHGSHTFGTIAATGGNGVGVSGVAQVASVMALRFLGGANGSGTTEDAISCIDFATENGAVIMSNSWGGGGKSQAMEEAVKRASEKGILFVAAAGNSSSNNDSRPTYPASYDLPNVLVVAATDKDDVLASFSNFGIKTVHVAAPGVKILSTTPNNNYEAFSGTSMATPHVSGVAALLKSAYPQLQATELKALILESVEKIDGLSQKVSTGGRISLQNAFQLASERYGAPQRDANESDAL